MKNLSIRYEYVQKGQIGREVLMRDVSTDYTEQSTEIKDEEIVEK